MDISGSCAPYVLQEDCMKELAFVLVLFGFLCAVVLGMANDSKKFSDYAQDCASRSGVAVVAIGGENACVLPVR